MLTEQPQWGIMQALASQASLPARGRLLCQVRQPGWATCTSCQLQCTEAATWQATFGICIPNADHGIMAGSLLATGLAGP